MAESKVEEALQNALTQIGWGGWSANPKDIPGKPDICWPYGVPPIAVFVDGCFWHGCPQHFKLPKKRRKSWANKIFKSRRNDRGLGYRCISCGEPTGILPEAGWIVVRVWEHDIKEDSIRVAYWVQQEIVRQARLKGFSIDCASGKPVVS